ncbi:hypothetical protein [Rhodospira trueperi]|uniref:ABC-type polysaccharide/polyol phosphate export permease n=1 Tax=Rhodospira trueperi TaxID=69960 RepID=A0A1G7CS26_9PROT|nr:hypothetical protein [Rhodospira trueperi]SDE42043.1 ABC-type polysaccharide/polyol phosphate export permease [Rhodospira trueperi]
MKGVVALNDLRGSVRVARALSRRERLARERRHAFGRAGEALGPLWPLLVYLPLVAGGALPQHDTIPPLAYAALGYWTWSLLVDAALAPTRGLTGYRAPAVGPAAAVLAGLLDAGRRALSRTVVLWPLALIAAGGVEGPGLPAALAVLSAALVLALGVGVILALWAAPWPDVPAAAATAARLTLLPSLALFPLPDGAWAWAATVINPLALFTEAARALALTGTLPHGGAVAAWSVIGVALLALGLRGFVRLAPRLREGLA